MAVTKSLTVAVNIKFTFYFHSYNGYTGKTGTKLQLTGMDEKVTVILWQLRYIPREHIASKIYIYTHVEGSGKYACAWRHTTARSYPWITRC